MSQSKREEYILRRYYRRRLHWRRIQTSTWLAPLDVFRGITMAAMVVVNNPGDWGHVYAPLLHAPWQPADLHSCLARRSLSTV